MTPTPGSHSAAGSDGSQILNSLEALRTRSGPDVYEKLLDAMSHSIRRVRSRAADILVSKGPEAAEHVKNAFVRLKADQAHWGLSSVARIQGTDCIPWMVKQYQSQPAMDDAMMRSAIINAVGEIEGEGSIEFLMKALEDASWPNRYSAAESLEKKGNPAVIYLKRAFSEGQGEIKFWALQLFVRILGNQSAPLLRSCMNVEEPDIRYGALQALSESDEEWAIDLLLEGFNDTHWANRRLATRLLVGKSKDAVGPLIRAMETCSVEVLHDILRTLGKIADDRLIRPVSTLLLEAEGQRAGEIREWCVEALGAVRSEATVRRLLEMVQEFPDIANQTSQVLVPMGCLAYRLILKGLLSPKESQKKFCRDTIQQMGFSGGMALARQIESMNKGNAESLMRALKGIPQEGLDALLREEGLSADRVTKVAQDSYDAEGSAISRIQVRLEAGEMAQFLEKGTSAGDRKLKTYPISLDEILIRAIQSHASDIHIKVGMPPIYRIAGALGQTDLPRVSTEAVWEIITKMVPDPAIKILMADKEMDLSYDILGVSRFRINIYSETQGYAAAIRVIPDNAPRMEDLDLPKVFWKFTKVNQGLILLSGPTGSGKSTTLAAMINEINETRELHVLTIEDPIEFRHINKKCLITSRELGVNTNSFSRALKSALREDPDVILVGEMRDPETIGLALTASETGHLVLSTVHTGTAAEGVERLVNAFPGGQQDQARNLIAQTLKALICQTLVPTVDGRRTAALEIMVNTYAIANLIREKKMNQIDGAILTGRQDGMVTRDDSLYDLCVRRGRITRETAVTYSKDRKAMEEKLPGTNAPGAVGRR